MKIIRHFNKRFLEKILIRINRRRFAKKTNYPYLSGDVFRDMCELSIESLESPNTLSAAKSIFIPGHLLDEFIEAFGSKINAKVIVSGNSDQNFFSVPELPVSVKLFLCQNLVKIEDERAMTIPIGLENIRLGRSGQAKFHKPVAIFKVSDRVLVPPMAPTNPIRTSFLNSITQSLDIWDIQSSYLTHFRYFAMVKRYRFILVLEGNGFDSHRLWEVLYQGAFPIVLSTKWSESLRYLGLPILYINDFEEVNLGLLQSFEVENSNFHPEDTRVLWAQFWFDLIESKIKD